MLQGIGVTMECYFFIYAVRHVCVGKFHPRVENNSKSSTLAYSCTSFGGTVHAWSALRDFGQMVHCKVLVSDIILLNQIFENVSPTFRGRATEPCHHISDGAVPHGAL
jgi:hypothetical protein